VEIKKTCEHCGAEYNIPHWRNEKSKFCSRVCSDKSKKAKPKTECKQCNKLFHKKKSRIEKSKIGNFCSNKCLYEFKKEYFKGENNHQYGLKGHLNSSFKGDEILDINHGNVDIKVYSPNHPHKDKDSRVLKHRLIVEENYLLFDLKYFDFINGKYYLKRNIDVHHKDFNHDNNSINNLEPITRSEHTKLHNLQKIKLRDKKGRFMKEYNKLEKLVIEWAREKGILDKATPLAQAEKTFEEVQELIEAVEVQEEGLEEFENSKGKKVNTKEEIKDALGDILVTIIIGAELQGLKLTDCLESAYNVISKRTGKMVNGQFVKNEEKNNN
jgi:NTP pyrophosphatase (non-canonical NTP hydrolase)